MMRSAVVRRRRAVLLDWMFGWSSPPFGAGESAGRTEYAGLGQLNRPFPVLPARCRSSLKANETRVDEAVAVVRSERHG
jgi:hypothetical protein